MNMDFTPEEQKHFDEALFINRSVYGDDIDQTVYENKHYGNPYKLKEPFSISYEDDEPAGLSGFLGMRIVIDGEVYQAAQSMDVAVLKKFQGRGHFSKVMNKFEYSDNGCKVIFGLPNDMSFPRAVSIGYTSPVWLHHYMYFNAPFSFALGGNAFTKALDGLFQKFLWLKAPKADGDTVLTIYDGMDNVPVTDEEVARLYSDSHCHFLHDQKTYQWKQSYNPDLQFHWAVLRKKDGTLLGYALCHLRPRMKGNFVIIDDYAAAGNETDKRAVLKQLFASFKQFGNILEVPFVNSNVDGERLKALHFANACKFPYKLRGCPLAISPSCKNIEDMIRCNFRNIDSDVI
ncbi:GNAT family N-acetyltransferase [Butyrivibrio sp. CB08]|uniref:GNAT family N-acetyltransferase n=1 Tax=Butyrivibrio sp. CB08 TaxID=2364879 RepID=UPI000EA8BE15|nr:GNAT family N-acetyltransferase [Butyrivibrio sp. CB08]RKM61480.1 GNAT family N-acetyltransferase [Butyrivibrio sp. CB08]